MRSNEDVADVLERVADLLEAQHEDGYRVRAYRRGARTVRSLDRPVGALLEAEGRRGLEQLPTIGTSLASSIEEFLITGRLRLLDRLEGQVSPEDLFTTLPGIGEELAHRIHEHLHVDTLEELEQAAHDGRLEEVPGIGPRRVRAIRDELAAVLSRSSRRRARRVRDAERSAEGEPQLPSVRTILDIDADYRAKAVGDRLRRIAPRRFNPSGEAWLPVLHLAREGWYFTALFSNSARAHRLGTIRDWVVIFFERDGHEGQCTVVTEHTGALRGQRVVRGREAECVQVLRSPA